MKATKLGLLVVVMVSILGGWAGLACANPSTDKVSLPGTIWVLDKMGDEKIDSEITIRFDDERISGNASCNNYFTQYTLNGDEITLGPVGSTMMACLDMEYEGLYLKALSEVTALRIDNEQLIFVDGDGSDVLVYTPMQHASLEDNTWQLMGWNTGSAISSLIVDSEITLEFSDEQASGTAGCNHYFGSYELKDDNLNFGMIANTEMACMEPEGVMEQEVGYLKVLAQVETYSIEGVMLTMYGADGNQLLNFTVVK